MKKQNDLKSKATKANVAKDIHNDSVLKAG